MPCTARSLTACICRCTTWYGACATCAHVKTCCLSQSMAMQWHWQLARYPIHMLDMCIRYLSLPVTHCIAVLCDQHACEPNSLVCSCLLMCYRYVASILLHPAPPVGKPSRTTSAHYTMHMMTSAGSSGLLNEQHLRCQECAANLLQFK